MKAERWQQINDLFQSAAERAPEERAAFLDGACHGDETLCREVESLIASYERAENFIESPAFEVAPELLTNEDRAGALVGESIGHYWIESLIGAGGMGEVYLARDELLGRKVALKFLPESLTADEAQLTRLEHEARTASALNHPNILTVHEIGVDGSRHFIATEFIEGITLRASLARGRMNLHDALGIAVQVASALAAAHETGVVHRDIKPENIMLRPDGYVKVLDFGIAKLTEQRPASDDHNIGTTAVEMRPGLEIGTARYMSPEQACGGQVDKGTDIWSLGVVLYEMVTGHAPFTGDTPREAMSSILEMEPPPLTKFLAHTPAELQQIISKTLRKNREERYHSAHELLEALKDLRHKLEFGAELERATAAPSWLRWTRSPTALVLVLLMSALALALPFYWHRNLPTSLPPEKSIAVLPFENLSKDEENTYFAGGVQDEILTNLAKVADLKVISRMSVMKYKSGPERNLREIAKALGVSHVVEGSVQGAGGRVRVSAQLIDARTDTHLWAELYDRDVADVFAIQTEIAQQVANQLQAKLSAGEKAAIAERPTSDLAAYDLYLRAKELIFDV